MLLVSIHRLNGENTWLEPSKQTCVPGDGESGAAPSGLWIEATLSIVCARGLFTKKTERNLPARYMKNLQIALSTGFGDFRTQCS